MDTKFKVVYKRSQAGIALTELAIILVLLIAVTVPILLNVLLPGYMTSTDAERIVAGLEPSAAAGRRMQQLSLEGLQIQRASTAVRTELLSTALMVSNIGGTSSVCAAEVVHYIDGAGNPQTMVGESSDESSNTCATGANPVPPAAITDFVSSVDPIQTGYQVGMIVYQNVAGKSYFMRQRTITDVTNGAGASSGTGY